MKYTKKTIKDFNLNNKTIICRLDLNVPMKNLVITDDTRIKQSIPTLNYLLDRKCKIVILSHLGRIKTLEDKQSGKKSLELVAKVLADYLPGVQVFFSPQNTGPLVVEAVQKLKPKQILLLENTRYQDVNDAGEVVKAESKNNHELGAFWASLGDVFVNDAFGTAHRAHASNVGIAENIEESAIGLLIERELLNLEKAVGNPKKPLVTILGGAKISDKLQVVKHIVKKADFLLIGGGMAYTFQSALGHNVGTSLLEANMVDECKNLLAEYPEKIIIPVDNLANDKFADEPGKVLNFLQKAEWNNMMGLDIGPETIHKFLEVLDQAGTVIWNGPVGVFEFVNYQNGTKMICEKLAEITKKHGTFTLIGGGDSAAAFHEFVPDEKACSFISTGGGASLAYLEDSPLPGIEAIQNL